MQGRGVRGVRGTEDGGGRSLVRPFPDITRTVLEPLHEPFRGIDPAEYVAMRELVNKAVSSSKGARWRLLGAIEEAKRLQEEHGAKRGRDPSLKDVMHSSTNLSTDAAVVPRHATSHDPIVQMNGVARFDQLVVLLERARDVVHHTLQRTTEFMGQHRERADAMRQDIEKVFRAQARALNVASHSKREREHAEHKERRDKFHREIASTCQELVRVVESAMSCSKEVAPPKHTQRILGNTTYQNFINKVSTRGGVSSSADVAAHFRTLLEDSRRLHSTIETSSASMSDIDERLSRTSPSMAAVKHQLAVLHHIVERLGIPSGKAVGKVAYSFLLGIRDSIRRMLQSTTRSGIAEAASGLADLRQLVKDTSTIRRRFTKALSGKSKGRGASTTGQTDPVRVAVDMLTIFINDGQKAIKVVDAASEARRAAGVRSSMVSAALETHELSDHTQDAESAISVAESLTAIHRRCSEGLQDDVAETLLAACVKSIVEPIEAEHRAIRTAQDHIKRAETLCHLAQTTMSESRALDATAAFGTASFHDIATRQLEQSRTQAQSTLNRRLLEARRSLLGTLGVETSFVSMREVGTALWDATRALTDISETDIRLQGVGAEWARSLFQEARQCSRILNTALDAFELAIDSSSSMARVVQMKEALCEISDHKMASETLKPCVDRTDATSASGGVD